MTLVLCANVGGKFCITTADTLTAHYKVDVIEQDGTKVIVEERKDHMRITKDTKKVHLITQNVIWAAAGQAEITADLRNELEKRVEPYYTVLQCAVILDEIIQEKRENENNPFYYRYLDQDDSFAIVLNGFVSYNETAYAYYISGYDKAVLYHEVEPKEYVYKMAAPSIDYSSKYDQFLGMIISPDNYQALTEVLEHLMKVHSVIAALEPEAVSETCDYIVLTWTEEDDFNASGSQGSIDVTPLGKILTME